MSVGIYIYPWVARPCPQLCFDTNRCGGALSIMPA